jgi:hypothetical protein
MKAVGPRFRGNKYGDDDREESRTKSGNEWNAESGRANKRSVWTLTTTPYKGAHFATFPQALVEPCPCPVVPLPKNGSNTTSPARDPRAIPRQPFRRTVGGLS